MYNTCADPQVTSQETSTLTMMEVLGAMLVVTLACLATWLFYVVQKWICFIRRMDKLPGPRGNPITLTLKLAAVPKNNLVAVNEKQSKKYGPLYRSWVAFIGMVHLSKPEHVAVILSNKKFLDKPYILKVLAESIGNGLITSSGEKWRCGRKLISPAFHNRAISSFQDIFVEKSELFLEQLTLHDGKQAVDLMPYIKQYSFDVICGAAMGVSPQLEGDSYSDFMASVNIVNDFTLQRLLKIWLTHKFLYRLTADGRQFDTLMSSVNDFVDKVICRSKARLSSESSDKLDDAQKMASFGLPSQLYLTEPPLTDEEIRDQVKTFIAAGYETSAVSIYWTLFMIGHHMEVQEKLHEELDRIFQGSDRPASEQDLHDMRYLEMVLHEVLRLYPSAPIITRDVTEDIQIGQHVVPAGAVVSINIYNLHRSPEQFPTPDIFDPDNFLPHRVRARHPYAYIPFSAGPRSCIGKRFALHETKTLLSSVLRKYKVHSTQAIQSVSVVQAITLRPGEPLLLRLERRT